MKNGLKEIGFAAFLLLLAVLLVLSLFWALSIGTVKLPLEEIYAAVLGSVHERTADRGDGAGAGP